MAWYCSHFARDPTRSIYSLGCNLHYIGGFILMTEEQKKALEELSRLGEEQEAAQEKYEEENDAWWESLTQEEQMDAFHAVVKRIVQGELRDRGTYRYVLYDVFGFGSESYGMGMNCGFMELHNSIYTHEEMRELRDRELAAKGIKVETVKLNLNDENS